MYRSDKITQVEQVKANGTVVNSPFYLFLCPKTSEMKVALLNGKLIDDVAEGKVPVVPNEWNPMVFKSVDITSDTLANYDVFIGKEG